MKLYTPAFVLLRILLYALIMFGISEAIFFDAAHPMEEGYFGEISLTEIGQEILLFCLFLVFLVLGLKWPQIQAVANLAALFFLMSFFREFNFLTDKWLYPVLGVLAIMIGLFVRDFKKIKNASIAFFKVPASGWLLSGVLVTYIFSRLFGRSSFWRLLYHDESYRLAKAATEEGLELLGDTLMLISAIEFVLYFYLVKRKRD